MAETPGLVQPPGDPPDDARAELATTLRRLRRARGLTQRALVEPLYLSAHSAIADYEAGRRIPPADVVRAYERVFALPEGALQRLRAQAIRQRAEEDPDGQHRGRSTHGAGNRTPLAHGDTISRVLPRQLPMEPTWFTGRDGEIRRLDELLARGGPARPVVISGMPGVGKTALAVWWAHRRAVHYPDGILYVNLRGYDPTADPLGASTALDSFLRALGFGADHVPYALDERAALFRSVVAERQALVVLDNARDAQQVRPLLPGGGEARAIVTSRSAMAGLVARDGAAHLRLEVLSRDLASRLLRLVLTAASGQDVTLDDSELRELARLCGGLPLALRLAAHRVADEGFDLAVITKTLAEPTVSRRLDTLGVADDEESTVRGVLSWSYRSLDPAEQRLLRLLGLVDGPDIERLAAAALVDLPAPASLALLDRLVAVHLLDAADERYAPHDLVRAFGRERAEVEDAVAARTAALARYTAWLLHTAVHARVTIHPHLPPLRVDAPPPSVPPIDFGSAADAFFWCERERASLVAAVHTAYQHGFDATAWQLATALYGFFDVRKYWDDWISTHRIALDAAMRLGDRDAEGRIWCNLGNAYRPLYQFEEALECYRSALVAFAEVGYRQGEAKVLGNRGTLLQEMGLLDESVAEHGRARAVFDELDDRYGVALTLTNLGYALGQQGRIDEAVAAHTESLELFQQLDDVEGQGRALSNMGKAFARAADLQRARETHLRALDLLRTSGNRFDQAYALVDLLAAEHALGEHVSAIAYGREAVALFTEIGHESARAEVLILLAEQYRLVGDAVSARDCQAQAADAGKRVGPAQRDAARRAVPALTPATS